MKAVKTLEAVNAYLEDDQERDHRTHLGASVLGHPCSRKIWYGFRWAGQEEFNGQKLRLFDRGNEFEPRAVEWCKGAGMTIWEVDDSQPINPETGKHPQFRITDCNGHFGGSLDGIGIDNPDIGPGIPFLCEFKTHNNDSFKGLTKQGFCQSKNEHFVQMQLYMYKMGLPWGLYFPINKNDDKLFPEIAQVNPTFAVTLLDKARRIVASPEPPPRVGDSPGHWICKSKCSAAIQAICHQGAPPEINCRTCRYSKPIEAGQWVCSKYGNFPLSKEHQETGCDSHHLIEGFLKKSY